MKQEMGVRGLKPVFGPMSTARNKRLLLKAVEDEDKTTADAFQVPKNKSNCPLLLLNVYGFRLYVSYGVHTVVCC